MHSPGGITSVEALQSWNAVGAPFFNSSHEVNSLLCQSGMSTVPAISISTPRGHPPEAHVWVTDIRDGPETANEIGKCSLQNSDDYLRELPVGSTYDACFTFHEALWETHAHPRASVPGLDSLSDIDQCYLFHEELTAQPASIPREESSNVYMHDATIVHSMVCPPSDFSQDIEATQSVDACYDFHMQVPRIFEYTDPVPHHAHTADSYSFRFLNWNLNLVPDDHKDALIAELDRIKWDVCAFQEWGSGAQNLGLREIYTRGHYLLTWGERGGFAVAILVHQRWKAFIREHGVGHRFAYVDIWLPTSDNSGASWRVFSVHMKPTSWKTTGSSPGPDSGDAAENSWFETLDALSAKLTPDCLIGVDANAQVGDIAPSGAGGPFGYGTTDERGMLLMAWLLENKLVDAHSWLERGQPERYTHVAAATGIRRRIDYTLIPASRRRHLSQSVIPAIDYHSDHIAENPVPPDGGGLAHQDDNEEGPTRLGPGQQHGL
jgi:exonuclease III